MIGLATSFGARRDTYCVDSVTNKSYENKIEMGTL